MQIGNRLFPYPIVNKNKDLSDYLDNIDYKISFLSDDIKCLENSNSLLLKDIHISLNDTNLIEYINAGDLKSILIVESPESVFRKQYAISTAPKDIKLPLNNLSGKVTISSYLYATKDIDVYKSQNFIDEISRYKFSLRAYEIVGIDDGFTIDIKHDDMSDNPSESIFEIIPDSQVKFQRYQADEGDSKIYIHLPKNQYNLYYQTKGSRYFENIYMSLIVIPTLVDVFNFLQSKLAEYTDIIDLIESYPWFKSVALAFNRERNKELDLDVFRNINALELAQIIFRNVSMNAIEDAASMILDSTEGDIDGEN